MIIDFHTHTFPDKIAARAIEGMQQKSHAAAFARGTVSDLTQSMAESSVDLSVVLPVATNPAKLVSVNDVSIAMNGKQGLVYFGAMHPMAENWKEELTRLHATGIQGIKLHPFYQGVDVNDVRTLRILGKAAELGMIVVIHAGNEIAYPGQVRCSPEMAADALRQVGGENPVVLAHMGGWKNWDRVLDNLADSGCYMDTAISLGSIVPLDDGHYTDEELPLLTEAGFVKLVRGFGSERVLFGTDSPWACQKTEIQKIQRLSLTQQEKDNLLGANARQILNLL